MILSEILSSFVAKPTAEVSTVVCGADTAGSLAGDSWKFTVTDMDGNDVTYQPYYIVNSVGADPTLGVAEIDAITNRADAAGDLASKYFTLNNGISTAETAYYIYFTVAGAGYDPKLGQFEITDVTLRADSAADLNNKYWNFRAGADAKYHVYYWVIEQTSTDPAPSQSTGICVKIINGETVVQVAKKTAEAINAVITSLISAVSDANGVILTSLVRGALTNATDGNIGGAFAVSVTQGGVAAVSALSTKTLLGVVNVASGAADEVVAAALVAKLTAAGWTAAARAPTNDHIVDVTHPTKGNCTNSADGNVGGAFGISVTTGVDPTPLIPSIAISIATGAANTAVATATKAAMEAVVNVRLRMSISLATATLTLTNKRKGVVADTADVSTGWTITGGVTQGAEAETTNMGQNVASANYFYQPPEGKVAKLRFLTLSLSDTAVTTGTSFGALTGLTNGFNINVCSWDGTVVKTLVGSIKTNSQFLGIGLGSALGATYLQIVIDLVAWCGGEIVVDGSLGEYFEMDVNDNLNGIDGFYMQVSGFLEDALRI